MYIFFNPHMICLLILETEERRERNMDVREKHLLVASLYAPQSAGDQTSKTGLPPTNDQIANLGVRDDTPAS